MSKIILEAKNITKSFGATMALDGVSLIINSRETVGIVGQSGSGKTTLARILLGLIMPSSGEVLFQGINLNCLKRNDLCRRLQVVFQDPYSSLNPRQRIDQILSEPLQIHQIVKKNQIGDEVDRLLALVRLNTAFKKRFPHELSGGERQRVGIARALALRPEVLIADEPISSLDQPLQEEILELLRELKKNLGLTLVFVSHDLEAVAKIADRIAVMESGKIVEIGNREEIFLRPKTDYTKRLIMADTFEDIPAKID